MCCFSLGFHPGKSHSAISVSPGVADANGQTQLGSGPWQSAGAEHCQPSLGWECQRLSITLIPEGYFNIMTQGWVQHEPSPAGIALSPPCVWITAGPSCWFLIHPLLHPPPPTRLFWLQMCCTAVCPHCWQPVIQCNGTGCLEIPFHIRSLPDMKCLYMGIKSFSLPIIKALKQRKWSVFAFLPHNQGPANYFGDQFLLPLPSQHG